MNSPNPRLFGAGGLLAVIFFVSVGAAHSGVASELDFAAAGNVLEAAIAEKVFPGCSVAVGTSRGPLWVTAYGFQDYDQHVEVTRSTLYDLASLTKVLGTTSVVMRLIADDRLRLDESVSGRVPELLDGFDDDDRRVRRQVTVEHLLTHSAGLPAWRPFYKSVDSYEELLSALVATPLDAVPGATYKYSDLGFILLGELAARAGNKPLAQLEQELVFRPLGMNDTLRNPPPSMRGRIAPTEETEPGSGEYVQGVVHDENCRAAEGITGHAGLFSTADDVATFATHFLSILREDNGLIPRQQLEFFTRRRGLVEGSSRALGWDTPSGESSAGDLFSRRSFGHTGFTGTSIWVDVQRDLYVILLTNRVHPTRKNSRIHPVRRRLADAVARIVDAQSAR